MDKSQVKSDTYLTGWQQRLLVDYLDEHASHRPDGLAIVDYLPSTNRRIAISFADLKRRVDLIARNLIALGVEPGDVVSMQLPNWWHFVAVHLACTKIGATTNPLMPIFRERELSFMLKLAESKVVIVPRRFRDHDHEAMIDEIRPTLPALKHIVVVSEDADDQRSFERVLLCEASPSLGHDELEARRPTIDGVVQLLYTSGTTGEPKGVMHTSRSLLNNMLAAADGLSIGIGDPILSSTPLAHQLGFILGVIIPTVVGMPNVLQDIWNADVALDRITENHVTFGMGATPFLADLVDCAARRGGAGTLRTFLSAGAPIPRQLVKRARQEIGFNVLSAYGMTENLLVSSTRIDDADEKVYETDGTPTIGIDVRVVDVVTGEPLPIGMAGKLLTSGSSLFKGYLKRPELYNVDHEGWFDTGDLARVDSDGYVTITGRSKDVIIRGGENIPVVEIENVIYRHPAVKQVAIVAMPDERLGERCCAFVVMREDASLTFEEMQLFLKSEGVARSYWPERLEFMRQLPMTASGKVQKYALRDIAKGFVSVASARRS